MKKTPNLSSSSLASCAAPRGHTCTSIIVCVFFTFYFLLFTFSSHAQNIKPYLSLAAGYTTDHYLSGSAFFGVQYHNQESEKTIYAIPFAEFGTHLQATLNNVPQVISLNSGIEFHANDFFASAKLGASYVFNVQVEDIHKTPDTIIILTPGAAQSWFWSPSFAAAAGYRINDVPFFISATYTGKMMWYGAGIKVVIGE
jgi:hypothetical protein